MTKGIILSGGYGTRLRPLSCAIPKSLMPVVNKPVIERQILLLKAAGVKEIVLAVSVMSEVVKQFFGDGKRLNVNIHYTNEKYPMGTAGAIRLAQEYLKDDNFFMLNGDVIMDFNFSDMLKHHQKYGGIGTIASRVVEDPSRYGVLIVDNQTHLLQKFLEKEEYHPPAGKIKPMPINAGVYILEPDIFSYIQPKKKVSIERDVFPKVANDGKLYHYAISGIWKDIGKPSDLLEANILLMTDIIGSLGGKVKNLIDDSVNIDPTTIIHSPCTIGKNVVIRKNCIIGPNVIIGDDVYVEENTEIKSTLIYNESYISKNASITNAIISDNCLIEKNVQLAGDDDNLIILASFVKVNKDVKLLSKNKQSISYCHHEVVKESVN
jgi:NDP-sugar pyrophosphorylase family protein